MALSDVAGMMTTGQAAPMAPQPRVQFNPQQPFTPQQQQPNGPQYDPNNGNQVQPVPGGKAPGVNYATTAPDQNGQEQQYPVPGYIDPNAGPGTAYGWQGAQYAQNAQNPNAAQANWEKYSITRDPNYQSYLQLGAQAQQQGQTAGAYTLGADTTAGAGLSALQQQQQLASGQTADQQASLQNLGYAASGNNLGGEQSQAALNLLQNAAQGNGPTAADIQQQAGISQAMRAQLTAASSARGGAYAQAAAQQQAAQQASQIQLGGVGQAAQLRAQELQAAQGQFAGAAGQFYGTQTQAAQAQAQAANQQYAAQVGAAQGASGAALAQQQLGLGYYTGQQTALQEQQQMAGNLATSQVNADYGLAGTALQTQTQQNIANQQQQQQEIAGGIGLASSIALAAASDERLKEGITPQGGGGRTADSMLDTLAHSASTFSYRDDRDQPTAVPRPHGATYGGVMAQDLERVPEIGPQLVLDTPHGKMVETRGLASALAMALGREHQRVRALEQQVRR